MTSKSLIHIQSDYTRLIREIHELRARITELTALRDDLVYTELFSFEGNIEAIDGFLTLLFR